MWTKRVQFERFPFAVLENDFEFEEVSAVLLPDRERSTDRDDFCIKVPESTHQSRLTDISAMTILTRRYLP